MQTQLEFHSPDFRDPDGQGNTYNPDIQGRTLAAYLSQKFRDRGFDGQVIEEDWGWMIELKREPFPLWLGCASHGGSEGWLVFIEPSKPIVRKWFKKFDTRAEVSVTAKILEEVVTESGATNLKWWSGDEPGRK